MTFSAAAQGRALVIDRDTVLSYVSANSASVVSCDPTDTTTNVISAPTDRTSTAVIAANNAGTGGAYPIFTDFPLSAGEQIFVSKAAAGFVQLFFTDQP